MTPTLGDTPTPGAAAPGPPPPATLAAGAVGTLDAESEPGTDGVEPAGELAGLLAAAAGLVGAARAANTRTAYASDWARFAGLVRSTGPAGVAGDPGHPGGLPDRRGHRPGRADLRPGHAGPVGGRGQLHPPPGRPVHLAMRLEIGRA